MVIRLSYQQNGISDKMAIYIEIGPSQEKKYYQNIFILIVWYTGIEKWNILTHCGLVMQYGIWHLGQHWFKLWFGAWQHQDESAQMLIYFFLSNRPVQTFFSKIVFKIKTFLLKKMHLKLASAKWQSSYLGLNVLMGTSFQTTYWLFFFTDHWGGVIHECISCTGVWTLIWLSVS